MKDTIVILGILALGAYMLRPKKVIQPVQNTLNPAPFGSQMLETNTGAAIPPNVFTGSGNIAPIKFTI